LGLGHIPTFLISPWKKEHKLSCSELLQFKQLRNFTESNQQNDGSIYLYFKLKISGDLHLLLQLIDNWETYKKKPELFHEENLASLTRCRAICARKAGIKDCGSSWVQLQTQKPDLVEAILAGNYDADITMNPKVNLVASLNNTLSTLNSCVPSICRTFLRKQLASLHQYRKSLPPKEIPPEVEPWEGGCEGCGSITTDTCLNCSVFIHNCCQYPW
jgi:hypothetical protein